MKNGIDFSFGLCIMGSKLVMGDQGTYKHTQKRRGYYHVGEHV